MREEIAGHSERPYRGDMEIHQPYQWLESRAISRDHRLVVVPVLVLDAILDDGDNNRDDGVLRIAGGLPRLLDSDCSTSERS